MHPSDRRKPIAEYYDLTMPRPAGGSSLLVEDLSPIIQKLSRDSTHECSNAAYPVSNGWVLFRRIREILEPKFTQTRQKLFHDRRVREPFFSIFAVIFQVEI